MYKKVNGFYVSQLNRYAKTCSTYKQFIKRGMLLTNKLLEEEYQEPRL